MENANTLGMIRGMTTIRFYLALSTQQNHAPFFPLPPTFRLHARKHLGTAPLSSPVIPPSWRASDLGRNEPQRCMTADLRTTIRKENAGPRRALKLDQSHASCSPQLLNRRAHKDRFFC
jgi:hypothetical protein